MEKTCMPSKKMLSNLALLGLIVLSSVGLAACSSDKSAGAPAGVDLAPVANLPGHIGHNMADISTMPEDVKNAPATVQGAYSFAVGNPGILKRLPCYCGCNAMGHSSLYACYVESVEPSGKINFDTHALGCQICVDIAQDGMRLTNEGQSVEQIKAYVDETYAQYGTSNLP
jgi:hypothetical protein